MSQRSQEVPEACPGMALKTSLMVLLLIGQEQDLQTVWQAQIAFHLWNLRALQAQALCHERENQEMNLTQNGTGLATSLEKM